MSKKIVSVANRLSTAIMLVIVAIAFQNVTVENANQGRQIKIEQAENIRLPIL